MFPDFEFDIEEEALPEVTLGKVFLFDFDSKQYVMKDGSPVEATYEEAVKQWVSMLLITELDKYNVYLDSEFGMSLAQFIGRKDIPLATITSEVRRQISEKVLLHPEITGCENFVISRDKDKALMTFNVLTRQNVLLEGIESEVKYSG